MCPQEVVATAYQPHTRLQGGSQPKDPTDRLHPDLVGLDLRVEPGKAPMTVNSGAKVANLNSDMLDGKSADAIGVNGWQRVSNTTDTDSISPKTTLVTCPGGTRPVGVGYAIDGISSSPPPGIAIDDAVVENGLQVRVTAYEVSPGTGSNWSVTGQAICATAGLLGE
jgi:hypothetical protein